MRTIAKPARERTLTRRTCLGVILLFVLNILAAPSGRAQEAVILEEQVKAAFLYNFVRFVEWPQSAFTSESAPITIGVLGNDEFATRLATLLKEKKAHSRSFDVKKLGNPSEATGCQMIFVAQSESKKATQVVEATKKQPALLVGETDDFLDNGGIINFVRDNNQLRFDINPKAAEDRKLVISSHLLRLARKTKNAGGVQ